MKLSASIVTSFAALLLASQATSSPTTTKPSPTPMPSAKHCSLFAELHPPTQAVFDQQHLSPKQRAYVLKYVKLIPAATRKNAMWMRDSEVEGGLVIFDVFPVMPEEPSGGHAAWTAVNTNEALDPIECHFIIMPVASLMWPTVM